MDTYQMERRELLESVLETIGGPDPDEDKAAVCCRLLRHLIRTGRRPAAGEVS